MSFASLQELARNGQIQRTDTVRSDPHSPWRFADSIPQLFPPRNATREAFSSGVASDRAGLELWFYKLDDREHGPISIEELKSLAAVSGETANEIVVRSGRDGAWIPLGAPAGEHTVPADGASPVLAPIVENVQRANLPASRFRTRPRKATAGGRLRGSGAIST